MLLLSSASGFDGADSERDPLILLVGPLVAADTQSYMIHFRALKLPLWLVRCFSSMEKTGRAHLFARINRAHLISYRSRSQC